MRQKKNDKFELDHRTKLRTIALECDKKVQQCFSCSNTKDSGQPTANMRHQQATSAEQTTRLETSPLPPIAGSQKKQDEKDTLKKAGEWADMNCCTFVLQES